jgi:hypothetical protein
VAREIRELSCPGDGVVPGGCTGFVANHLALSLRAGGSSHPEGGYYGSQAELAQALDRALAAWKVRDPTGMKVPLIVNLSLGWDSVAGYDGQIVQNARELFGPAQSVYAAIARIVCNGGLVIASAGNHSRGSILQSTTGPMFPAAWEKLPAPTDMECAARYGATPPPPILPPAETYRPLLYAAGGVNGTDRRLLLTRDAGQPRLVAHSFEVTSTTGATMSGFNSPLTGTSVSAAAVSAAAAVVWGTSPGLTAPDVMAMVYGGAVDLAIDADFCLGGTVCNVSGRTRVRRVSVCGALQLACTRFGCGGASPQCVQTVPAYGGSNPTWSQPDWEVALAAVDGVDPRIDPATSTCPPGPSCSPDKMIPTNAQVPFTGPQPPPDGCDACFFSYYGGGGWDGGWMPAQSSPSSGRVVLRLPDQPRLPAGPGLLAMAMPASIYLSLDPSTFTWSRAVLTVTDLLSTQEVDLTAILLTAIAKSPPGTRSFVIQGLVVEPPVARAYVSFQHTGPTGVKSTVAELITF